MKRFLPTNSTCAAVLGLMIAAFASGCANEAPIAKDPQPAKQQKAAVTTRGMDVQGCSASAVFDISSSEDIEFIAIDRSDVSNLRAELYTLDESGRESRVEEALIEVDASFQSLLDATSNNVNASELSRRLAREAVSSRSSSTSTESNDHSDSTRSHTDSSIARDSSNTVVIENSRNGVDEAIGQASNEQAASENTSQQGGLGSGMGSGNSRQASASARFEAVRTFESFSNIERRNQAERESESANQSEDIAIANRSSRTTTAATQESSDRASEQLDQSARDEASAANRVAQSQESSLRQRNLAMVNLEFLRSRNLVLRIELQADENHEVVRVFTGSRVASESSERRVAAQGDAIGQFAGCTVTR